MFTIFGRRDRSRKSRGPAATRHFELWILLASIVGTAGGCTPSGGVWKWHRDLAFSPDGKTVLYAQSSGAGAGAVVGPAVVGPSLRTEEVVWFAADRPEQTRRLVFDRGWNEFASDWGLRFFRFSPSGRHVALIGWLKSVALDLETGKTQPLHLGWLPTEFSSENFTWLGDSGVVYWTERSRMTGSGPWYTHEVFRQQVGAPVWRRERVFREEGARLGSIVLAPGGRSAFLEGVPGTGQSPRLLDTSTGRVREVHIPADARAAGTIVQPAWRPDGMIIALLCHVASPGGRSLFEFGDREVVFVFEPIDETAGGRVEQRLILPNNTLAEWTRDGRYLLVDAGRRFYGLIQPDPWDVIPLMDKLEPLMTGDVQQDNWQVRPLLPGWLWLRNWTGEGVRNLAVDYEGKNVVPLTEVKDWGVSADGRYIAEVDESDLRAPTVRVRPLNLPERPVALATSGRPS